MTPRPHSRLTFFCLLALSVLLLAGSLQPVAAHVTDAAAAVDAPWSDLSPLAQVAISATLGRNETIYHATPLRDGFQLGNPIHELGVALSSAGARFEAGSAAWTLALAGWGYGEILQPLETTTPQASQNRVEYRHGDLTEWYANGPLGIQQGFTIAPPPTGGGQASGPLTVALDVGDDLTVRVAASQRELTLHDGTGTTRLRYHGLMAYDAREQALPAWLELTRSDGSTKLLLHVDDQGARYPLLIGSWVEPGSEQAKLYASDAHPLAHFGNSVAVDGDTIVVGAYGSNVGSNDFQGAAYVFVKPPGGWTSGAPETARLTVSDGMAGDYFGQVVAIDGDTIVVTTRGVDNGSGANQGAAYVFIKPDGGWTSGTETAKLITSDDAGYQQFGLAAAIDGDTIAVGAYWADHNGNSSQGAVYVFVKPSGGWTSGTETARLTSSDGGAGDWLGESVAVVGDTIVAGAQNADKGSDLDQGAAYIFVKPDGGWTSGTETAKLTSSDGDLQSRFGHVVKMNEDTIFVGASDSYISGFRQRFVYVFVKPEGGWTSGTESARLTSSDGVANDGFGADMAVDGEMVVVSAATAEINGVEQGAAYVFVEPVGGWEAAPGPIIETTKLTALDGTAEDDFGGSVAVMGGTIVVGAEDEDLSGSNYANEGAAYVFTSVAPAANIVHEPAFVVNRQETDTVATRPLTISNSGAELLEWTIAEEQVGGSGACVPDDLPWLSVTPSSGTTATGASSPTQITFDATGLSNGNWDGVLCLSSNDPNEPVLRVPVRLAVHTISYVIDYEYHFNDGLVLSGTSTLYDDGAFTDSDHNIGVWDLQPSPDRLRLLYPIAPCKALLVGHFVTATEVGGGLLCRDGSDVRGAWIGEVVQGP